ncbi:hypothetical protein F66182_9589 [Fusarium sp. NRRL 66182]|nr:hypothetical protein F66182_9589 [Fusarium sp. NRRL 66182]
MQPKDNPQKMPNSSMHSLKRHFSQSRDVENPDVDEVKRQFTETDKSPPALTHCDVLQTPGSSFTLAEFVQSSNTDVSESPQSSLGPSLSALQDPYDDPYDDPDIEQHLESLTGSIPIENSGTSHHLKPDTHAAALEQTLEEFLEEES